MITIHIGLPRTASTYIQEKIFENTHIKKYLPKTLKGNYVSRILSSNNSNKIKKLIYLIQKKKIITIIRISLYLKRIFLLSYQKKKLL